MPASILLGLERLLKEPTEDELDEYCKLLQRQPCPACDTNTQKLNANMTSEVLSIVFITRTSKKLNIACPDCLDNFKKRANSKTIFMGLWAFPWGPVKVVQSLIFNSKMSKYNHLGEPNPLFTSFVYQNIGALEAAKDSPAKLRNIISVN